MLLVPCELAMGRLQRDCCIGIASLPSLALPKSMHLASFVTASISLHACCVSHHADRREALRAGEVPGCMSL
jgi:hypothetical protein